MKNASEPRAGRTGTERPTQARIEDYALIGDCEAAALVCRNGSIDWLCWPRFDSDACFAALLGTPEHGRWLLAPAAPATNVSRAYQRDTLILETRFECDGGVAVLTDFMPPRSGPSNLIRRVACESGRVAMRCELIIRFGYGAAVPWMTRIGPDKWRAVAGPDMLVFQSPVELHGENFKTVGEFTLEAGEQVSFVLLYCQSHLPQPAMPDVARELARTQEFWRSWIARASLPPRYADSMARSLITLRALIYRPTGGIVAAPTTSLPERLGGVRNWDYRFCWLRDATQTLLAFMAAGLYDEASAWRDWLMRAVAGSPRQSQIMYGVAGERRLTELELGWLPGYCGSAPVRIGNAAASQLQLDVFGELMDAFHQSRAGGLEPQPIIWALERELLEFLEQAWREPDCGIWEIRGPPQHFTYSKIMCWVAYDRAIKDAQTYRLDGPIDRWRDIRDTIREEVCTRGFNTGLGAFVQAYESSQLDASLLLIPQLGFLPCSDPRMAGTIAAIERTLMRDGLVIRYDSRATKDGLPAGEGMFLACSFWLADAYAMSGRQQEAQALFERLVALANDVGLFAEEYDSAQRRMLGNFPQAFSHLSLVGTACNLAHVAQPAQQRSSRR